MAVSVLHCCYAISDLSITVRNLQPRPLFYNTITAIDQRALVHASLASCYFESAAGYARSTEEEYGAPSLVPPISASAATVHLAQQRTQPQPAPPVLKKRKRYRKMYPGEDKGITEEMRFVAMKLRNSNSPLISNEKKVGIEVERNLSGSESDSESSGTWLPSIEGCMKYLVDSKLVFQTLERIVEESNDVSYAYFRKTGLERSAALTNDLEFLSQQEAEVPEPSSPGLTYAAYLEELAQKSAPLFLSHFYNVYLAHLSGGQVIAKQVSDKLLDGRDLEFYKWESDPELLLKDVRDKLNKLGENWSRDDKNKCLKETTKAFRYLGQIVLLIIL